MLIMQLWEVWSIFCMNSSTALPRPNVQLALSIFAISGQPYSLTCTVQVVQYLAAIPDVTWLDSDGNSLQTGKEIMPGNPIRNGTMTTLQFTINTLNQSHTGNYTCLACISINKLQIQEHCGQVMADLTLSGKCVLSYLIYFYYLCVNLALSSRKG